MGLFQKLKKGLSHGGVKVQLEAPATVKLQTPQIPVTVTVTATNSAAQINSVQAQITCETSQSQNFALGSGNATPTNTTQTISQAQSNETFSLNPGESKVVQLSLILNLGNAVADKLDPNGVGSKIANAIGGLESLSLTMSDKNRSYRIVASADVETVILDPSASQLLQVLKPGEIGTGFNLKM